ncbi:hypothetical protein E4U54_004640 [Claviceps lovelessii]|nr:hypothetical protein E4U54_004640 [Claviceps lovelessii]
MSGPAHMSLKRVAQQQLLPLTNPSSPQRPESSRWKRGFHILVLMAFFATTWRALWPYPSSWTLPPRLRTALHHAADDPASIPNQVHLVKLLHNPGSREEFSFRFTDFLSVYAAWHHWRPHALYLHTNAVEATITGGRDGLSGKWTQYILQVPNLTVLRSQPPSTADNGVAIPSLEHKAEFVAVQAVRNMGGLFVGFDMYALRDIRPLRTGEASFVAHALLNADGGAGAAGAAGAASVSHDFFMSSKGGSLVSTWANLLHQTYSPDAAASPSDVIVTELTALAMARSPADTAFMTAPAFESDRHNTSGRNGNGGGGGGGAERDWSKTYVLQMSESKGNTWTAVPFESVTPMYLLESRSEFARAMYPVTRAMVEKGLIRHEDKDS